MPEVTLHIPHPLDVTFLEVLQEAMPRQEVTDQIPREAEDFHRGDKHFKHVLLPTYLICLSPKDLYR